MAKIPFNKASFPLQSAENMMAALRSGEICGDGPFTRQCEALLQSELSTPRALLTTSCTHALEAAALLADIRPGDEVIVPSFTFVSTASAFALRGATPVFADIRPDTLNMSERHVASLITEKTKAIVPVHYGGIPCEMDELVQLSKDAGVHLVEDNAHGLFARYRGKSLGTFGALATQSFHATKNFSCGEGGALLINEPAWIRRAEIIREKGTNRLAFMNGWVSEYTWLDHGSSYCLSDILAGLLLPQLCTHQQVTERRRQIWTRYLKALQPWADQFGVKLPYAPSYVEQAYHLFYMVLPSTQDRQELQNHLKALGTAAPFHYLPLHLSQMGRRLGGKEGDCPVTEAVSPRLLRLPLYNSLTDAQVDEVIQQVTDFSPQHRQTDALIDSPTHAEAKDALDRAA